MFNKAILIGRLVSELELREHDSGTPQARGRLAVNRAYKDKNGQWQEETLFISFSIWGERAKRISEKAGKGDLVLVEGRLRSYSYEKDGEKRTLIEVAADTFRLLRKAGGTPEEIEEIEDIEF